MAPPPDPPSTITLRIKVPPGHIAGGADEFTLGTDIPISSTIGHIRDRIQQAIPSRPTPARQRLLYGGRALVDNEQTVADALNAKRDTTQTEYVVHLLIKGDGAGTAPVPHRGGVSRSASPAAPVAAAGSGAGAAPPPQQTAQQAQMPPQHIPHHAAVLAQQQRLHAQMLQNAGQNRFTQPHLGLGAVPFGMQPMNFGGQMPVVPFPQQQQHGMAGALPGMAFQQAVDQGPQNRAATGLQAVGPQPNGQQENATGQSEAQADAQTQTDGVAEQQPGQQQAQAQVNAGHIAGAPQPPHRPLSNQGFHMEGIAPNGDRFTIHQQTLNFPHAGIPGQQMPFGQYMMQPQIPGFGPPPVGLPPLPGMPQQTAATASGPSALDRARANIAEMRRMLEELRSAEVATEAQTARIERLEERTRALNEYIDPLHLGNAGNSRTRSSSRQYPPYPQPPAALQNIRGSAARSASQPPHGAMGPWQQRAREMRQAQQQQPLTSSSGSDVTCYLLSSPTGPHAILYTPQHGAFTGTLPQQTMYNTRGGFHAQDTVAQTNTTGLEGGQPGPNQLAGQAAPAQQAQAQAQAQAPAPAREPDPLGPLAPILGHVWLLLRIMIFSYFLLGAHMGWRRPLALAAIGMGFWMIRMGLLGDGGALRRWWEGIMQEHRPAQAQQDGQQQGQGQEGQAAPAANNAARPGQMPTPEQVAQRLLNEDARVRNERFHWLREQVRPVERAVALLLASLWPGVGEAYVRAREQEERRRAEAEVAARRAEEEEEQRQRLADEKKKAEAGGEGGERSEGKEKGGLDEAATSAAAAEQGVSEAAAEGESEKVSAT